MSQGEVPQKDLGFLQSEVRSIPGRHEAKPECSLASENQTRKVSMKSETVSVSLTIKAKVQEEEGDAAALKNWKFQLYFKKHGRIRRGAYL